MAREPGRNRLAGKIRNFGRTTHHCISCNKTIRGVRDQKAHAIGHMNRWTSAKARKAARAMGKDVDRMRRHAAGWLEAAGLRDERGKGTAKSRSRPQPRGKTTLRQMRQLHRHDRHHERAAKHDAKASRTRNPLRSLNRQHRAANLRNRWPERAPRPAARPAPAASRPAPARPASFRVAPWARSSPSRSGRSTR